jgi:hypothetical protein
MKKRLLTATISALAVLMFAAGAQARSHHGGKTCVEILKSKDVMMDKGKAHVFVVNMNGHEMVAIPADMIPDPLHQQLFTVEGQ